MTLVVLAGTGVGLALVGLVIGLRPAPRSALAVLRSLDRLGVAADPVRGRLHGGTGREPSTPPEVSVRWGHRRPDRVLGARMASALDARDLLPASIASTCSAAGTTVEALCAEVLLGALAGVVTAPLLSALLDAAGLNLAAAVPAWSSVVLGLAGGSLPILVVRSSARRSRRAARTVVSSYLDLVVLGLAGGMGIEGALHAAAGIADDEHSSRIVGALEQARDAGATPWETLSSLGREWGLAELEELAAAVRLAGTEGARIRSTLAAKAASIRRHELADAEADANAVTERLFLPGALLLVGFLVFVGYPAVARITGGL